MRITEHSPGDIERLEGLIAEEPRAKQRDRCRIALLALRGWEKPDIASALGVAPSTVELWAYRYRDLGVDGLTQSRYKKKQPRLSDEHLEKFKARFTGEPRESDGVCTLRAKDAARILENEFGVAYSIPGVYKLLHRLGLSCLTPRPRHEKNDPARMEAFKKEAPLFSTT